MERVQAWRFQTERLAQDPIHCLLGEWNIDREGELTPDHGLPANRYRATDGGFDIRKCHDTIAASGAAAIIPPQRNGRP